MHKPHLIRIHKTGIAHHIAAVGEIDGQHRTAAVRDGGRAMPMQAFILVGADVASRKHLLEVAEEFGVNGHHIFEAAVARALFHHKDLAVALDDVGLDLPRHRHFPEDVGRQLTSSTSRRISGTNAGTANRSGAASLAEAFPSPRTSAGVCRSTWA